MELPDFREKRICLRTLFISSGRFFDLRKYTYGLAQIQDISVNGLGLLTEEELSPDFPLEMWVHPPHQDEYWHLFGDVVWSRKIGSNQYKVGIKFKNKMDTASVCN